MMKFNYPASVRCVFYNFPIALAIRLGNLASSLLAGSSYGTKVNLTQTPTSGIEQGDYINGSPLPELRQSYSDTGQDDEFKLKVSFDGVMALYRENAIDRYLRFNSVKRILLDSGGSGEDDYRNVIDCETSLLASESSPLAFPVGGLVREHIPSGYVEEYPDYEYASPQYMFFYGNWYAMNNLDVIKITLADGVNLTLTYHCVNCLPYFTVENG